MADLSTGGSGGGSAYTYVQDAEPSGAEEGESWYDTGANAAYVYDGASWIEQTVVDHGELSGVGSNDHHAPPTGTVETISSGSPAVATHPKVGGDGDTTTAARVKPDTYDGTYYTKTVAKVRGLGSAGKVDIYLSQPGDAIIEYVRFYDWRGNLVWESAQFPTTGQYITATVNDEIEMVEFRFNSNTSGDDPGLNDFVVQDGQTEHGHQL